MRLIPDSSESSFLMVPGRPGPHAGRAAGCTEKVPGSRECSLSCRSLVTAPSRHEAGAPGTPLPARIQRRRVEGVRPASAEGGAREADPRGPGTSAHDPESAAERPPQLSWVDALLHGLVKGSARTFIPGLAEGVREHSCYLWKVPRHVLGSEGSEAIWYPGLLSLRSHSTPLPK